MSLSLLAGVTVHGEDSALSYAWVGLCERDLQFALNCTNFREIDPPVDEPVTVRADAAQVSRPGPSVDAFRHLPGRDVRRPACDAVNASWSARLLRFLPALAQEARHFQTEDQCWSPIIDGCQPLFQPTPNGVLMDAEQARDFLHRIIPVN